VVVEDWSEPKLAVSKEVKPDLVRVEVSVEVDWDVLVDVDSICTSATSVKPAMEDVEVGRSATALELAADGE